MSKPHGEEILMIHMNEEDMECPSENPILDPWVDFNHFNCPCISPCPCDHLVEEESHQVLGVRPVWHQVQGQR